VCIQTCHNTQNKANTTQFSMKLHAHSFRRILASPLSWVPFVCPRLSFLSLLLLILQLLLLCLLGMTKSTHVLSLSHLLYLLAHGLNSSPITVIMLLFFRAFALVIYHFPTLQTPLTILLPFFHWLCFHYSCGLRWKNVEGVWLPASKAPLLRSLSPLYPPSLLFSLLLILN